MTGSDGARDVSALAINVALGRPPWRSAARTGNRAG
jgi:hypothetical protein